MVKAARRKARAQKSKKRFERVIVIGLGGIWSYLRPILCRTMTYQPKAPKTMRIVDYDVYSRSNLERQEMFPDDEARLKSQVHGERIQREFPALGVERVDEFVTAKNIARVVLPNSIIMSCVDNQPTRKLLAEFVRKNAKRLKNIALISGASDDDRGNAHLHLVADGKEVTQGMDEVHPEIMNTKDKNPGDMSCEERARLPGGGQTAVTNMMSASLMANYFWHLVKGGSKKKIEKFLTSKSEVFYNFNHLAMDSTSRAKVLVKEKKG